MNPADDSRSLVSAGQLLDGLRHESHPHPLQIGLDAAGSDGGVQLSLQPSATPQQVRVGLYMRSHAQSPLFCVS